MVDGFAKTPRYFLRDGSHPTSPVVVPASSGKESTVIFGFSDKPEYDQFLDASSLALTPYPMVKGFLQNQIALTPDTLKLIVLDAVSPRQFVLYAATMQSVLESFQSHSDSVAISHQLILDESSNRHQVQGLTHAEPDAEELTR